MNTLGERIKLVRKSCKPKLNQEEFAKSLGVSLQMIYTYEKDRVVPNDAFKMLLCRTYHVNDRWLESGEGEMFNQQTDAIHRLVEQTMTSQDKYTRRIVEQFLKLPKETRDQLIDALRTALADEEEENDDEMQ